MPDQKKWVLVVDDEPDVCETVVEMLADFEVDVAGTYDDAVARLSDGSYDLVILDIMGVKGHELLDLYGRELPCIMLTAHAFTAESFERSVRGHARLFLPKEEMGRLEECVHKVLSSNRPLWGWLLRMFDYPHVFGPEFMAASFLRGYVDESDTDDNPDRTVE